MIYFSLKETPIFKALKLEPFFIYIHLSRKISLSLSLIFLFFYPVALFLLEINPQKILGGFLFFFFIYLFFLYLTLFIESSLKKPKPEIPISEALRGDRRINLAAYLDFPASKVVSRALREKEKSSSSLLCHTLSQEKFSRFVFSRLLIDKDKIVQAAENSLSKGSDQITDCFYKTITQAAALSKRRGKNHISLYEILVALAEHNRLFKEVLLRLDLDKNDLELLTSWKLEMEEYEEERKRFWDYRNLLKKGTIAKQWIAGHTPLLDQFSIDVTEELKRKGFKKMVGHKNSIKSIERILSGQENNNVILVGKPGTGRRSLINELARKSFYGTSLPGVNYKRVVKLDIHSLVAQVEGRESTEKVLSEVLREATVAGNIILVIDNLHEFVSGDEKIGVNDISGILEPFLSHSSFILVGITNFKDYRTVIARNIAIASKLKKVELGEVGKEETLTLIKRYVGGLENRYGVYISYKALKKVIDLSDKFLPSDPFPEKALNLLEEAVVMAGQKKVRVLEEKDVAELVSEKTEVPVGEMEEGEKEVLLNLEKLIHKRIVNQETAVTEISKGLRRARAELRTREGLIGSFLFLGPTGVGKTETAKAISEVYFKSEERMIRLDMSEFQSISDISRLIGSSEGEGILTEKVLEDPFSLILLDEIEKAHKDILNIFLQILDEGHITDGVGRRISFKNCMIIATSNAGYKLILEAIEKEETMEEVREKILDYIFTRGIFRPEFVNRFDATVVFEPLSKENLLDIASLQLGKIKNNLSQKRIDLEVTPELKKKIVEISYEPIFGARQMQRIIQSKVGDVLASALISDEIKKGDRIKINPEDFSIIKL